MLIPRRGVALVGASLMQAKAPAFASVARDGGKGWSLRLRSLAPQRATPWEPPAAPLQSQYMQ